jgi:hypothetical protein
VKKARSCCDIFYQEAKTRVKRFSVQGSGLKQAN